MTAYISVMRARAFDTQNQTISLLLRIIFLALPFSYLSMLPQSHVVPPPHVKALLTKYDFFSWSDGVIFSYNEHKNEEKHNISNGAKKNKKTSIYAAVNLCCFQKNSNIKGRGFAHTTTITKPVLKRKEKKNISSCLAMLRVAFLKEHKAVPHTHIYYCRRRRHK